MSALNLGDHVTPNHWSTASFEKFETLSMDAEFDLIAPLLVFFRADCSLRTKARAASLALKKAGHPVMEGQSVRDAIKDEPDGLIARYNALVMAIVEEENPSAEAYIDSYGAFCYRLGDDQTIAAGDAMSLFGFYLDADALRARVNLLQ